MKIEKISLNFKWADTGPVPTFTLEFLILAWTVIYKEKKKYVCLNTNIFLLNYLSKNFFTFIFYSPTVTVPLAFVAANSFNTVDEPLRIIPVPLIPAPLKQFEYVVGVAFITISPCNL